MRELKVEPNSGVEESSGTLLAWLLAVELIGRMAVVELDLEGTTDVAKE